MSPHILLNIFSALPTLADVNFKCIFYDNIPQVLYKCFWNFTLWDSRKNLGRSAAQQLAAGNFIRGQGGAQGGQDTSKVPKLKSRVHLLVVWYHHSMPACWCQHPHLGPPPSPIFFVVVVAQWLTERGKKEVWENISFLRILIYLGEENGLGHRSSFVSGILLPKEINCPKMMHHFVLFFS